MLAVAFQNDFLAVWSYSNAYIKGPDIILFVFSYDFFGQGRLRWHPTRSRLGIPSREAALAGDWEWSDVGINNLAACAAKLAEMGPSSRF